MKGLASALDALILAVDGGGLDQVDDLGLMALLQDFEAVRNRLPVVDTGCCGRRPIGIWRGRCARGGCRGC